MKSVKIIVIGILLTQLFSVSAGLGQVVFQFIPELYGRNVNGLFNCRLINPGGRRQATLTITVSERKNGDILSIRSTAFTLSPGSNTIPASAVRNAAVQYSNNQIGVIIRHDHDFPSGDYEYCFTLNYLDHANDAIAEQCFNYELVPFAELNLVEPYDKDTVCDKRPMMTWQPLLPGIQGSSYQLVLTEVKAGQNAVEALNYNLPVVNQPNITATVLPYPAISRELVEGNTYAWQVTAYKNHTILSRSETWTFKVQCRDARKKPVELPDDGYRDIDDLVRGNYYIADAYLKFAVTNPYPERPLKYQITPLVSNGKKIKGLPKVTLARGRNKLKIDLFNTDAFTDGNSYVLDIWLPDGTEKSLKFIYKDQ